MSCKFIWYNLPKQIKDKLGINDGKGWGNIPKRVNNLLDTLKTDKPTCYNTLFPKGHNIIWHDLPNRIEKVCELVDCEEPSLINFDVTANWGGLPGVSDESSFLDYLEFQGANNVIISNFNLTAGRLTCLLSCDVTFLILNSISITEINKLEGFNGLTELYLDRNQIVNFNPTIALPSSLTTLSLIGNQIVNFNPTIALPSSLTTLYLNENQMTIAGYTASEPWANLQPTFTNTCEIWTGGNPQSAVGTNLASILNTKNAVIND